MVGGVSAHEGGVMVSTAWCGDQRQWFQSLVHLGLNPGRWLSPQIWPGTQPSTVVSGAGRRGGSTTPWQLSQSGCAAPSLFSPLHDPDNMTFRKVANGIVKRFSDHSDPFPESVLLLQEKLPRKVAENIT